ncbi:MAG: hypothetical protein ACYTFT_05255 [Planctomycetota bacterium]
MQVDLKLPRAAPDSLQPATVLSIYFDVADPVREGEPLVQLIHGDGLFDVFAPAHGMIVDVPIRAGQKVYPGTTLLTLEA